MLSYGAKNLAMNNNNEMSSIVIKWDIYSPMARNGSIGCHDFWMDCPGFQVQAVCDSTVAEVEMCLPRKRRISGSTSVSKNIYSYPGGQSSSSFLRPQEISFLGGKLDFEKFNLDLNY